MECRLTHKDPWVGIQWRLTHKDPWVGIQWRLTHKDPCVGKLWRFTHKDPLCLTTILYKQQKHDYKFFSLKKMTVFLTDNVKPIIKLTMISLLQKCLCLYKGPKHSQNTLLYQRL